MHVTWALAAGGTLEDRPRYNKTRCFDPFPFPVTTPTQTARIRDLGERLDAHRKRQQALHPSLTLTDLYNVVEKLRSGEPLTKKEYAIHEMGLATVLLQIHEELDAAVADAYGWPANLSDQEILSKLVALNAERAEEERNGTIRYLRPEYQAPGARPAEPITEQEDMVDIAAADATPQSKIRIPKSRKAARDLQIKVAWPETLAEQAQAVRTVLSTNTAPATAIEIARHFKNAKAPKVEQLLETLATLGQARRLATDQYAISL